MRFRLRYIAGSFLFSPSIIVRVRQGSISSIELQGFSLDEDRRRLNKIIQNVWEDDSWLH